MPQYKTPKVNAQMLCTSQPLICVQASLLLDPFSTSKLITSHETISSDLSLSHVKAPLIIHFTRTFNVSWKNLSSIVIFIHLNVILNFCKKQMNDAFHTLIITIQVTKAHFLFSNIERFTNLFKFWLVRIPLLPLGFFQN